MDCTFVSKLPENPIGLAAERQLRYFGVDTSKIVRCGERLGVYYLENGASQRASLCVYDRKHSPMSEAKAADFD